MKGTDRIIEAFRRDRDAVGAGPEAAFLVDGDCILDADTNALDMTGFRRDSLLRHGWGDLFEPSLDGDDAPAAVRPWEWFRKDTLLKRIRRYNGSRLWVLVYQDDPPRGISSRTSARVIRMIDVNRWEESLRHRDKLMLLKDSMIRISQSIMSVAEIADFYDLILESAMKTINNAYLGSVLILEDEKTLKPAAWRGFDTDKISGFRLPLKESFYWLKNGGRIAGTLIIEDVDAFDRLNPIILTYDPARSRVLSTLTAPIVIDRRLFGFLNIDSDRRGVFTEEDRSNMEYFRTQIQIAISNKNLYTEMQYVSLHDDLTGVYNRRHFEELFDQTLGRVNRRDDAFSLVLLDVDRLKMVNDEKGHLAGDALLRHFAEALGRHIRDSDTLGRYGGDEFVVLYNRIDDPEIDAKMTELRSYLDGYPLEHNGEVIRYGFSYGIAASPVDGSDFDGLVESADRRMYAMKRRKSNSADS